MIEHYQLEHKNLKSLSSELIVFNDTFPSKCKKIYTAEEKP